MAEGQEAEEGLIAAQTTELAHPVVAVTQKIPLGQENPLRNPGRPRGVDDGDDVVLTDGIDLLFDPIPLCPGQRRSISDS